MPDFRSGFSEVPAGRSMPAVVPLAPTPPTTPPAAVSVVAPTLGLGLGTVTIIVAGNVDITTAFPNVVIIRR